MNYKISKPFAMQSPIHPTLARLSALPVTALLALTVTVSACAAGPKAAPASVTHHCKPQETVGFSCELQDLRVLSLCGSPDFDQFKGEAKDNPGYAYVAIGTKQGEVQFTYPPNPEDYKKHMYFWVSISAWPHMFVATDKGSFLHFSLDASDMSPENAPEGWPLSAIKSGSLCARRINRDYIDSYMAQMINKADWERSRNKSTGQ
ncbi:MAG: hypothetical protein U1C47_07175 [Hydrogenophaga sp.]|nr:hypothetical protein [Hydrogenophaga sp.]